LRGCNVAVDTKENMGEVCHFSTIGFDTRLQNLLIGIGGSAQRRDLL